MLMIIKENVYKNELNELSKKFYAIPVNGPRKNLINKLSIFNGAKYFYSVIFQNFLVFISAKNILNALVTLLRLKILRVKF